MLGVCYYPEHWPEALWRSDALEMKALGLEVVRLGEFAWSRIEPVRDQFQFEWLDEAIKVLSEAGLKVVLCTPTATPPKWLIDEDPGILPVDPDTGYTRGFGSRRHYDFSSRRYLEESLRITEVLARRYGDNPAIIGWQTDNELCCHDTTLSASENALRGFRAWCADRYGTIEALNDAWGTVFWSMEYSNFDEVELPFMAVTETNPANRLAFARYSSSCVVHYHSEMVKVIRSFCQDQWVTHNFIPKEDMSVDTYALGSDLDFASYDNYPLGRSDLAFASRDPEFAAKYMRTGHPDFGVYYFDATKSFAKGDFWVMEQQPGPVNWASHNPRPLPGMIRFWTLEAFAHGAACVSYFRWRQVPFAQEQMHAGLKRPDNSQSSAWKEIEQVHREIEKLEILDEQTDKSSVAIVTTVEAQWVSEIQPQGAGFDFTMHEFEYYAAFRRLGVDVDFISKEDGFDGYDLIVVPCLPIVDEDFVSKCEHSDATIIFGPRSGSKTEEFCIPGSLPPGSLQDILGIRILSVETLRHDCPVELTWRDDSYSAGIWCEEIDPGDAKVIARYGDARPAIVQNGNVFYIGTMPEAKFLEDFMRDVCRSSDIEALELPEDLRVRRRGSLRFAFNYSAEPRKVPVPDNAEFLLGGEDVAAYDVAVWRDP